MLWHSLTQNLLDIYALAFGCCVPSGLRVHIRQIPCRYSYYNLYIHTYTHTYMFIHICVCMYTHTHIHDNYMLAGYIHSFSVLVCLYHCTLAVAHSSRHQSQSIKHILWNSALSWISYMYTLLLSMTIVNSFVSASIVFLNSDCWLYRHNINNIFYRYSSKYLLI